MVSSIALNKLIISMALLIAGCSLVLTFPSLTEDDEMMMNDDYDYDPDDQSSPSQQTKPSSIAKAAAVPQTNKTVSKTGILGEDVVLKCDDTVTKSNVILWYKDSKLITTGNSVVLPNFSLNPSNYELTILKASPQSAGDYYCQILPQKVFIHTALVLGDHSMDVITPESSKSGQSSLHGVALIWLLFMVLALKH